MDMKKILIVEDDQDINRLLSQFLIREGYEVVNAFSGTEAKLLLSMHELDLILLDLMLPGLSGEALIQEIRKYGDMPILVLSAKITLDDKVNALKSGADDYMTKPFERAEVLARVEALLRRSYRTSKATPEEEEVTFKCLTLKPFVREAYIKNKNIELTAYEFDILLLLVQNPNRAYTKEQLYHEVWKNGYYGEDNTINVHISNIRKKIKQYDETSYIKTVWGIGFKLESAIEEE